jgi:hypothetical protein
MPQPSDFNRARAALEQDRTLIAVVEMSLNSWLVAGIVPGIERHPLKKLAVDEHALLKILRRWQAEAAKAGHSVKRVAVAFEAGRDGFWLARWLRARDVEAYVIHASSVAVSREHRRAKTDRPAQASLTLRPAGSLSHPRRPLSRGFDPASYPTEPLASFQTYRQLSGWNPPPLMVRAFGAHCHKRTRALQQRPWLLDHLVGSREQ